MHILTRILTSRARGPQEGLPGARADRRGGARAEGQRPPEVDKPNRAVFCKASSSDPKAQWGATSTPMCDRKHSPKKRPPGASRSRHAGRGTPPRCGPRRTATAGPPRASRPPTPSAARQPPPEQEGAPSAAGGASRRRPRPRSTPPRAPPPRRRPPPPPRRPPAPVPRPRALLCPSGAPAVNDVGDALARRGRGGRGGEARGRAADGSRSGARGAPARSGPGGGAPAGARGEES